MDNYIKNRYFELWLERGIIHYRYAPDLLIDTNIAKIIVHKRLENFGGVMRPNLVDASVTKGITPKARSYLASQEALQYVSAGALVLDNPIQVLLGNAFLMINRPKVPSKMFKTREAALEWLEPYKNEE